MINMPPESQNSFNGNPVTVLMMTHVLPAAQQNAWLCSAGSKGYCAVKELLQNGIPGHTLLIESGDLREATSVSNSDGCCLLYCFPGDSTLKVAFRKHIPIIVRHITVYTNSVCIPLVSIQGYIKYLKGLLEGCTYITTLDLSPLSHVTCIPWGFLDGCAGLTELDLSPLSQVTEVQGCFLRGCRGLTTLDLSPFAQITEVHMGFLKGCTGLITLDLSPLSRVTEVRGDFLSGCGGLTALDLSPLSQVTEVQESFLENCTGLTTLDLSPLSQVTEVHEGFLGGCTGLNTLDLSPLSRVTVVHGWLLLGCDNIKAVDYPPPQCKSPKGWSRVENQWVRGLPTTWS